MYLPNELVLIENYSDINAIIENGIKGKIQIYIMNISTSQFHLLTPGEIQDIKSKEPHKATIYLQKPIYHSGHQDLGRWQYIGFSDLWTDGSKVVSLLSSNVLKKNADSDSEFQQNSKKDRREITLLKTIHLLTKTIAKSPNDNPSFWHGSHINAVAIAKAILKPYLDKNGNAPQGLSEENVRKIIADSLKYIPNE